MLDKGTFVLVYLIDPVERLWGRLVSLNEAGLTLRGFAVEQVEAFRYQFGKSDCQVWPQTVFFPMRRIQKMALDEATGDLPSMIDTLVDYTGLKADEILSLDPDR